MERLLDPPPTPIVEYRVESHISALNKFKVRVDLGQE